jgi:hypothetical protein
MFRWILIFKGPIFFFFWPNMIRACGANGGNFYKKKSPLSLLNHVFFFFSFSLYSFFSFPKYKQHFETKMSRKSSVKMLEEDADCAMVLEDDSRSIIMGLIAQVRKGTDLSRITLPTFVLEPRSMLEKITDFMSHPELCVK